MHIAIGILGFAAVLAATILMDGSRIAAFGGGLVHPPALLLLGVGPLFIGLVSYRVEEVWETFQAVARAARNSPQRSRARLFEDLAELAQELRRGRVAEALRVADETTHPLLRQIGPLAVKGYSAEALERTSSAATSAALGALRRCEDVLTTMARVAPAVGLVGTTLGLISLLRNLSNFSQLGPSMALALLCTFYGLVLANALYQPLARLVHSYGVRLHEESRLLTRALALALEGKPLADVRALFGETRAAEARGALALE